MDVTAKKDFFVSYNSRDEEWAEWIAFQLEGAGYSTILQKWDFRPGSNFVLEMDEAAKRAERTVLVLSPAYLGSSFTPPEWAAGFARDPKGLERRLIPVVVAPVDVEGLLGQIVHINVIGRAPDEVTKLLLDGVKPGRAKPTIAPKFPGPATSAGVAQDNAGLSWQPWNPEAPMRWRDAFIPTRSSGGFAVLEVHLVPTSDVVVPVRQLERVAGDLVRSGRTAGVFMEDVGVDAQHTADAAIALAQISRGQEAGLLVSRDGRRAGWRTLPNDTLGGILDPDDATTTVKALLSALLSVDAPEPQRWAPGVAITSALLLSVGSTTDLGRRTSATMRFGGRDRIESTPQDSVEASAIRGNLADIADEIAARVVAAAR
ncbi:toll/interleukin-1 receptor domain-containing protein [Curtobacterium flaccumfaciens]|uniref:toll/interleukin-1 receptor domain-containing protein n=1 Tax=Curtobacterium flaccumfaciens TaxID=2035 RepID=UPI00399501AA